MARYRYKAKEKSGNIINSYIDADSKEDAIEQICQIGYYPISVEDESGNQKGRVLSSRVFIGSRLKKDITTFTRQLANLLKSGIPLLKSIRIISDQAESEYLRAMLDDIFVRVKDGKSFSSALKVHARIFDHFFTAMVQAGEENGTLPDALLTIVDHRKKQDEIASKIKGALVYPAFITLVGIGSVFFILTNVMPKLIKLITSMDMELPPMTKLLIDTSGFLQHYTVWILIALLALYLLYIRINRHRISKLAADRFRLQIPLFGTLLLQSEFVRFTRTIETSLNSGLQMLKSIELGISVLNNEVVKNALMQTYDGVKSGATMGTSMRKAAIFPQMMCSMIAVGEESGRLVGVLGQIAEEYEIKVSDTTKVIMTLIEPAIILVIGSIIGFIVMALLLPVFQMDILVK